MKDDDFSCTSSMSLTTSYSGNPDAPSVEPSLPGEDGLGQGLGIILDKLRSIETKLDEIKTMEQNVWYPEVEAAKPPFPKVGQTPSASVASIEDFKVSKGLPYCSK